MTDSLPPRFRQPRYYVQDDLMSEAWLKLCADWLLANKHRLAFYGPTQSSTLAQWHLTDLDLHAPDLALEAKQRVLAALPAAFQKIEVEPWNPKWFHINAQLLHHGCQIPWMESADDSPGLYWQLTLARDPQLFSGGELEWMDGTTVEPTNNRLTIWTQHAPHRIRPIECWSAGVLDGRWSLGGYIDPS